MDIIRVDIRFFSLNPPPRNYSLASYFPFKNCAFEPPHPPSPLEFPLIFLGVGMNIFWNYTFHIYVTDQN